jgi:hypothetical protein
MINFLSSTQVNRLIATVKRDRTEMVQVQSRVSHLVTAATHLARRGACLSLKSFSRGRASRQTASAFERWRLHASSSSPPPSPTPTPPRSDSDSDHARKVEPIASIITEVVSSPPSPEQKQRVLEDEEDTRRSQELKLAQDKLQKLQDAETAAAAAAQEQALVLGEQQRQQQQVAQEREDEKAEAESLKEAEEEAAAQKKRLEEEEVSQLERKKKELDLAKARELEQAAKDSASLLAETEAMLATRTSSAEGEEQQNDEHKGGGGESGAAAAASRIADNAATEDDPTDEGDKEHDSKAAEDEAKAAAAAAAAEALEAASLVWQQVVEEGTGDAYWWNRATNEVVAAGRQGYSRLRLFSLSLLHHQIALPDCSISCARRLLNLTFCDTFHHFLLLYPSFFFR